MFDKILIANRGEIACRVVKTARRLGIRTVAVFSTVDRDAMHVEMADEAVLIGPAPARESYLNASAIIDAAQQTGAQAIHPGYGFLSENADFAEACGQAEIVFIGPPVQAIRAMGSKSAAKAIMSEAGVPLVPGYHGDNQDVRLLEAEARKAGYPVLIKASAGGGGRGMRIVEREVDLAAALESARRESMNAFGDDRILIEKYITRPRHIEFQVFADGHGDAVHLFERDCSVQRRHQKVIEEAPAPGMDEARRGEMGAAAIAAAQAIGYVGAGTVEFIVDQSGAFFFMEMNTRLQVEHPVTEMITGHDLVEWQLRVAFGEALPCRQDDLEIVGHAVEARIYAEDPKRDFLPQTGRLAHADFPLESEGLRVDRGFRQGDEISIHYDAMIAKIIAYDRDRNSALRTLRRGLDQTVVVGLSTNIELVSAVAAHPNFVAGDFDTGFIAANIDTLIRPTEPAPDGILALASLFLLLERAEAAMTAAARSSDPYSPWHRTDGWRLNDDNHQVLAFQDGDREVSVMVHYRPSGFAMDLPSGRVQVDGRMETSGALYADLDGLRVRAKVFRQDRTLTVITQDVRHQLVLVDPMADIADEQIAGGGLTAPMPGKIIDVLARTGQQVKRGTPLVILEAMKMEHTISAPADGTVDAIKFGVGEQVPEGAELIVFAVGEPS
ncbi:MAG: acetyl/propionyl/methylcrotonyl-CoA carboxylase subunit alpha [Alphaproteobacteria bacterium]|nr:acetyl/propionyl/methylcrotonyl-CoA carboxylase subunit alpha [Alphaproteobacteria bacterium]